MDAGRITALSEVPDDSTVCFRVTDGSGEVQEAILVRTDPVETDDGEPTAEADGVACWLNYCQHFTHIKLDKGSGAPMRNGELVCANHGAYFEADSGECTFGPCEGAYLTELEVSVSDGDVYLTDGGYEVVGLGPIEGDDFDRTSTSNVEF
ncbi:Rieske 2Fe-2S domain-containing protein [Natrinema sp. 1APR25-10V2]|uniref:Rieske (2Fe-2S) protein n=1 Tax=Natrinema sp. 1APR25-10V2 TaxID=2951081 RepID=UPI00287506BC|nr:Rieske 2Fe-2S domain-containing protein [Natrinema sp. 1APR25-10V2]MDS0473699.1 Rieske 2Fe-2S domain-containing protein [Natrinema sp. 1APR25-10V2]